MYLNTFIGGNVCATAKQAQERGGGQGLSRAGYGRLKVPSKIRSLHVHKGSGSIGILCALAPIIPGTRQNHL
jgi:hypothetical protein